MDSSPAVPTKSSDALESDEALKEEERLEEEGWRDEDGTARLLKGTLEGGGGG